MSADQTRRRWADRVAEPFRSYAEQDRRMFGELLAKAKAGDPEAVIQKARYEELVAQGLSQPQAFAKASMEAMYRRHYEKNQE